VIAWARDLLREIAASDPALGKGLTRFGTWQSLAAILGTAWLPLPRRASSGSARVVRQRLRALGAEPSDALPPVDGEPAQLRGTCVPLPGTDPREDLWRASVVEAPDGMWAIDEGRDFILEAPGGATTLVLCAKGRLVNAARLRPGDQAAVFGLADQAPDRLGLGGAPHGRGGPVRVLRSGASHPLLVSVIRRYDQEDDGPQD
jgi:hypothetical protein